MSCNRALLHPAMLTERVDPAHHGCRTDEAGAVGQAWEPSWEEGSDPASSATLMWGMVSDMVRLADRLWMRRAPFPPERVMSRARPCLATGLTTTRVATYLTASGVAQAKPDSTTNSARLRISVAGTRSMTHAGPGTNTRRDSATAVIAHSSDRTVTGLAVGSAARTINGTSSGSENTRGTNTDGAAFTAVRVAGDTIKALVVPVVDGRPTYPSGGSVIRYSTVTATVGNATPTVSDRREVITYNGTTTAALVITQDGVTKRCTVTLPRGRPVCP